MSRSHGIDPYEFNDSESEIVDYRHIQMLADATGIALDKEIASNLSEVIDTLYSLGYSPEYVDEVCRTHELREGSWN
jgi:Holliday junction resolvasome RuvABC DNA-binding subunit